MWRKGTRARALNLVEILLLGSFLSANALPNAQSYSALDEHNNCDHIIHQFKQQIMSFESSSICSEETAFPKPGNCSVFFKCLKSEKGTQPIVEYCSTGYNFVNGVCLPNTNSTDCPQYTCRIPNDTSESANDIELDFEKNKGPSYDTVNSAPLVQTSSSAPSSLNDNISTGDRSSTTEEIQKVHSEQLMQTTEMEGGNTGSSIIISHILFFYCLIFLVM